MADEHIKIDIKGIVKLFDKLDRGAKESVIKKSLYQGALHIAGWSKNRRLTGPRPAFLGVVSGRLRSSITASRTTKLGDEYRSSIGTNVKYAKVHELGFQGDVFVRSFVRRGKVGTHLVRPHTRRMNMPARPFLRPSIMDAGNRQNVLKILTENINEELSK